MSHCSQLLNAVGLILNTLAALILIIPKLSANRHVDDDRIEKMDKATGIFSQRKHIKDQKLNIVGFGFLAAGFVMQFVALFV